jgi:hypothetical protein
MFPSFYADMEAKGEIKRDEHSDTIHINNKIYDHPIKRTPSREELPNVKPEPPKSPTLPVKDVYNRNLANSFLF